MDAELKQYIAKHKSLFWYTPENKKENISPALLVETILNYGDMDAVKQLFQLMGIENVAKIFFDDVNQSERKKNNYYQLTLNYFTLLFKRHVH
jgi:FMN-dependent NADH-azoreductase